MLLIAILYHLTAEAEIWCSKVDLLAHGVWDRRCGGRKKIVVKGTDSYIEKERNFILKGSTP